MNTSTRGPQPLSYSGADAIAVSGLGRTRLYELINQGKLETRKVGNRRLINAASLRRLVTREAA